MPACLRTSTRTAHRRIGRARPALDELDAWRSRGVTVLWVPIDGQCAGAIVVADTIKPTTA
jgi:cation transport ATPase